MSRKGTLKSKANRPIQTRLLCAGALVLFPLLLLASLVWDGAKNITLYDIKDSFATLMATAFLPWVD